MSSFLGSLAKGFVKSAVNQVGRDGGKVISNAVYGDKHSTPVRRVAGSNGYVGDVRYGEGEITGEERQNLQPSFGWLTFNIVLAFFFNFIGVIFLAYNGLKRLNRKQINNILYGERPCYVMDGRTKSGERYDGHEKFTTVEKVDSTEDEIATDRKVGKIYIIAAAVILVLYVAMFVSVGIGG